MHATKDFQKPLGQKAASAVNKPQKDVMALLALTYRAVQVLMVAHGAALLSLVTTYIGPDGLVPEPIKWFLLKLALGFLFAVAGGRGVLHSRGERNAARHPKRYSDSSRRRLWLHNRHHPFADSAASCRR
jgi:hypothetical protein